VNRRLLNEHAAHTKKTSIFPATSLTSTIFRSTKTAQKFAPRTLSILALFFATTLYQEDLVAGHGKKHFSHHHEQQQKDLVDTHKKIHFLPPQELPQKSLIAVIQNKNCLHRHEYQQELIQSFHKKKSHSLDCAETLDALLIDNSTPFLTENAEKLFHAVDLFKDVCGFRETFFTLLSHSRSPHTAVGFLYELEVALTEHEKGERILSFGKRHQSTFESSLNREIDVETKDLWIECKNISWLSLHNKSQQEKLKHQLLDEQELTREQNQRTKRPKNFMLFSKQPIPADWQEWLDEQAINYVCTSDEESSSNSSSRRESTSDLNG
jgi:hypothetical protein